MIENIHRHIIETERCGKVKFYVQGDSDQARKGTQPVFLTVHDVGKNHNSWLNFVMHPSMNKICEKAVFIHVDLLGQQDDATDLPRLEKFPSMQVMGEDLINILDHLKINAVIGMGDGAGANIIVRFMASHAKRCFGAILINPTATEAKLKEQFKERLHFFFPNVHQSTKDYIILHRFGYKLEEIESDEELAKAVDEYKNHFHEFKVNKWNSKLYAESFLARDDITEKLMRTKKNILLICGTKSPFAHELDTMYGFCGKAKVTSEKIEGVGDVLEEAQDHLANSLLHFCQGLGWFTKLETSGIKPHSCPKKPTEPIKLKEPKKPTETMKPTEPLLQSYRRMSMEDYDKPEYTEITSAVKK